MEINLNFCKNILEMKSKWNESGKKNLTYLGYIYNNGSESFISTNHACHAGLRYDFSNKNGKSAEVVALINFIPTKYNDIFNVDAYHLFIDWMINFSHWAPMFITKDAETALRDEFVLVDTDYEYNNVAQALISMRFLWEFPFYAKAWEVMYKNGIDGLLAFAISHSCGESYFTTGGAVHTGINGANIDLGQINHMSKLSKEDLLSGNSYKKMKTYNNIHWANKFKKGCYVGKYVNSLVFDRNKYEVADFHKILVKKALEAQKLLVKEYNYKVVNFCKVVNKKLSKPKKAKIDFNNLGDMHPVDAWMEMNGE